MTAPIYQLPAHLLAPKEDQRLHLTDMSSEILLMIVEYVNHDIDYSYGATKTLYTAYDGNHNIDRSVFHLSQCSRTLRSITKPILYRRCREGSKSLPKFICKVLKNLELGELTWFFYGAAEGSESYHVPMDISYVQDADWARIQEAVESLSSDGSDAQAWIQELRNGVWDAGVALLLPHVPNLRELEFKGWLFNDCYPRLINHISRVGDLQILDSGTKSKLALLDLRKISIQSWDIECGVPLIDIIPFLRMLEETMNDPEDALDGIEASDQAAWVSDPSVFNIKTLLFPGSSIDSWSIISFLRHLPKLEKFYYAYVGSPLGSVFPGISAPRILQALSPLNSTLGSLTILNEDETGEDYEYQGYCIGSLQSFTSLTYVDMTMDMIIGSDEHSSDDIEDVDEDGICIKQSLVEALPRCIESLRIRGCHQLICKPLFELLKQKQELFPSLHALDIGWEKTRYPDKPTPDFPETYPGFTKELAEEFLAQCVEKGITIKMIVCDPKPKTLTYQKSLPGQHPSMVVQYYHYPYDDYEVDETKIQNIKASGKTFLGMAVVEKEELIPF